MNALLKPPPGMARLKSGAIVVDQRLRTLFKVNAADLGEAVQGGGTQRERLDRAQAALTRLSAGWVPDDKELRSAPVLKAWVVHGSPPHFFFAGSVTGHPLILDGRWCVTSPVIAYDGLLGGWIRTVSRWYRLGRPFRTGDQESQ